jgi:hypothetical protein
MFLQRAWWLHDRDVVEPKVAGEGQMWAESRVQVIVAPRELLPSRKRSWLSAFGIFLHFNSETQR